MNQKSLSAEPEQYAGWLVVSILLSLRKFGLIVTGKLLHRRQSKFDSSIASCNCFPFAAWFRDWKAMWTFPWRFKDRKYILFWHLVCWTFLPRVVFMCKNPLLFIPQIGSFKEKICFICMKSFSKSIFVSCKFQKKKRKRKLHKRRKCGKERADIAMCHFFPNNLSDSLPNLVPS